MRKLRWIAGSTLFYLGLFIVGANFIVSDIASTYRPAGYALWFALGVLVGFLNYNASGRIAYWSDQPDAREAGFISCLFIATKTTKEMRDRGAPAWFTYHWTREPGGRRNSFLVTIITTLILAALALCFYLFLWRPDAEPSFDIGVNRPLTLTFFGAIFATTIYEHYKPRPARPPDSAQPAPEEELAAQGHANAANARADAAGQQGNHKERRQRRRHPGGSGSLEP